MEVIAFNRSVQGTGASRRLRNAGKTPGIIYGNKAESEIIELDHNALYHALKKEEFHSSILDLVIEGKKQQVLLKNVQYHPFKQLILHVDFQRVDNSKIMQAKVPLHYLNKDISPAVKLGGATISEVMKEIEILCLPKHLPAFIEVDLVAVELDQSLHAKDIKLPKDVALSHSLELNNPVIVSAKKVQEVIEEKVEAPAEAETTKSTATTKPAAS